MGNSTPRTHLFICTGGLTRDVLTSCLQSTRGSTWPYAVRCLWVAQAPETESPPVPPATLWDPLADMMNNPSAVRAFALAATAGLPGDLQFIGKTFVEAVAVSVVDKISGAAPSPELRAVLGQDLLKTPLRSLNIALSVACPLENAGSQSVLTTIREALTTTVGFLLETPHPRASGILGALSPTVFSSTAIARLWVCEEDSRFLQTLVGFLNALALSGYFMVHRDPVTLVFESVEAFLGAYGTEALMTPGVDLGLYYIVTAQDRDTLARLYAGLR